MTLPKTLSESLLYISVLNIHAFFLSSFCFVFVFVFLFLFCCCCCFFVADDVRSGPFPPSG